MRCNFKFFSCFILILSCAAGALPATAQEPTAPIFDDRKLLAGYAQTFQDEPKDILLAMIEDETLAPYKMAAAVRVFRQRFSREIFTNEKREAERILWHRLNRTDSIFVQVEIMHTLCVMDRYKYFKYLVPDLIDALDHYNRTVNDMANEALWELIKTGHNRPREARVVFTKLRKKMFLIRKNLRDIKEPSTNLKRKLELIRWAVKILGTQELKRLPSEVLNLL